MIIDYIVNDELANELKVSNYRIANHFDFHFLVLFHFQYLSIGIYYATQ